MSDTKMEIILAMKEEFALKGYMASMSDISKRVGIKVPSIYSHFKSKDEIVLLCIKDEIETFTKYYRANLIWPSDQTVEGTLKHLFFAYIDYFKELDKLRFWNNFELIPNLELRHACLALYKQYMLKLQSEICPIYEQGILKKEIRSDLDQDAYIMYIVTLQGVLRGMTNFEGFGQPTDRYYEKVWKMYWESIRTRT